MLQSYHRFNTRKGIKSMVILEHQSLDIISAYEQINDVLNEFELLRINIDEEFYTLFKEVVELLFVKMNTQNSQIKLLKNYLHSTISDERQTNSYGLAGTIICNSTF